MVSERLSPEQQRLVTRFREAVVRLTAELSPDVVAKVEELSDEEVLGALIGDAVELEKLGIKKG
ncbi:MAG TPA: hypothetical protein PL051_02865 [Candidatus Saccharibacteria bacterium]|nr:hypothetical protein [Candidatus Saccharibacteria bacterium]